MQDSIWEPRQLNQYGDEGSGWLYRVLFPEGKVSISSQYWNSPWGSPSLLNIKLHVFALQTWTGGGMKPSAHST